MSMATLAETACVTLELEASHTKTALKSWRPSAAIHKSLRTVLSAVDVVNVSSIIRPSRHQTSRGNGFPANIRVKRIDQMMAVWTLPMFRHVLMVIHRPRPNGYPIHYAQWLFPP